jgi:hypothetical protein
MIHKIKNAGEVCRFTLCLRKCAKSIFLLATYKLCKRIDEGSPMLVIKWPLTDGGRGGGNGVRLATNYRQLTFEQ